MKIKKIGFQSLGKYKEQTERPEFAFVGRSNAGKSTLINTMLNRRINRVSKSPGCTKLLNIISVNDAFYIVDLPGYGFAKTSLKVKKVFSKRTEDYLLGSSMIKMVFLILDMRHAPTRLDIIMIEWLRDNGLPFVLLFNKCDRVARNRLRNEEKRIIEKLGFAYPYISVSGQKKVNLDKVERYFFQ